MKTQIKFSGDLTLKTINEVALSFTKEENQELHEKLLSISESMLMNDSFLRAQAMEWMRIGYLMAHTNYSLDEEMTFCLKSAEVNEWKNDLYRKNLMKWLSSSVSQS